MRDNFREEVERAKEFLIKQQEEEANRQKFQLEVERAKEYLRKQNGGENPADNQKPEGGPIGEKIARGIRGMAGTYGAFGDLAHGASKSQAKFLESEFPMFEEALEKSSGRKVEHPDAADLELGKKFSGLVDRAYGKDLTPKNNQEKFEEEVGAFLTPMGLPRKAALGLKALAKGARNFATKRFPNAVSASAAVNLTPRMTEEGTGLGAVEDVSKALLGSVAPGAAMSTAKAIRHPIKTSENIAAKVLSKFITPDERVYGLSEKHGVKLPFNVGADSHTLDFVANNYLRSMFSSKAYTESLNRSNQSMVDSVKRSLDTLGKEDILPSAGSDVFRGQLKAERKALQSESTKLYGNVRASLKGEKVRPKNLLKSLNSEEVSELLNNPLLNDESRKVVEKILKIKDKFGRSAVTEESLRAQYPGISEYSLKRMMRHVEKSGEIPVKDLISLRKYLLSSIDYNPEVYGIDRFLSKLSGAVDKDIKSMSNKGALGQYLSANKFYRENIALRFKNSIASSLLKGDRPTEAYNYMNSVQNVRDLRAIAGKNKKSLEIFNALSKAKAREIIGSAVEGNLTSEGTLRTQTFSNIFQKGEKRNELLEQLLGKREYNNLCELAEISSSYAKHGRNLLNTSGTAHVASDFRLTKNAFDVLLDSLGYVINGGIGLASYEAAGSGIMGAGIGASAAIVSPNVVSRLLANEKFVNKAREYARARVSGKEKLANGLLDKQLIPIGVRELSKVKESQVGNKKKEEANRREFESEVERAKEFLRSQDSS